MPKLIKYEKGKEAFNKMVGESVTLAGRIVSEVICNEHGQPVILIEFGSQPVKAQPVEFVASSRLLEKFGGQHGNRS